MISDQSIGKGYLGADKVQPHIVLVQVVQSIELRREVVFGLYIFIDTIWREHKIVLRFYVYLAVLDIASYGIFPELIIALIFCHLE